MYLTHCMIGRREPSYKKSKTQLDPTNQLNSNLRRAQYHRHRQYVQTDRQTDRQTDTAHITALAYTVLWIISCAFLSSTTHSIIAL